MPADPVEAGRKGGRSRSAAKLAACKRNGFQPRPKPAAVASAPDACVPPAPEPQPSAAAPVEQEPTAPPCAARTSFIKVPR
jgi:hypothetical protein